MAFFTVQNGPWPQGTTVAVWPTSSVSGGVPSGPALGTAVAYPDGTATFGGLTVGVSYTAIGSGGSLVFTAGAGTSGGGGSGSVLVWNGSTYVPATNLQEFRGPADPRTLGFTLSTYDVWVPTT